MGKPAAAEFDFSELTALDRRLLSYAERDYPKETKRFLSRTIGNEGRRIFRKNVKDKTEKHSGELRKRIDKKVKKNKSGTMVLRIYSKPFYASPIEFGHRVFSHGKNTGEMAEPVGFAHVTYEELAKVFPARVEKFLDEYLKGFET